MAFNDLYAPDLPYLDQLQAEQRILSYQQNPKPFLKKSSCRTQSRLLYMKMHACLLEHMPSQKTNTAPSQKETIFFQSSIFRTFAVCFRAANSTAFLSVKHMFIYLALRAPKTLRQKVAVGHTAYGTIPMQKSLRIHGVGIIYLYIHVK